MKLALTLALVLVVSAAGCGSDDDEGGTTMPPSDTIEIETGTWDFTYNLVSSDCAEFSFSSDTTLVACEAFDPGDIPTDLVDCSVSVSGNTIGFNCSGVVQFGECTVSFSGSGSGSVAPDKRTVTLQTPIRATFSQNCGGIVCNFTISVIGTWQMRSPCPEPSGSAFTPLQLVHEAIKGLARSQ